ncbi:MAG: AarF/UbiB family protein [bacterium]|nr:AarF/UbiB family protein [bacterium]
MGIKQKIYDLQRGERILHILIKYGFGYFVEKLSLESGLISRKIFRNLEKQAVTEIPAGVRLRRALEELGPTYVKLGQVLSMRPDIVTLEIAEEFEKLQDEVPPFPFAQAKIEIEQELNQPLAELFASFADTPKASASLAQVYEATLPSSEKVMVKVQRPDIEKTIIADIAILQELARLAEKHLPEFRVFDPVGLVKEFKRVIIQEIDFRLEASNIERFGAHFKDDNKVFVPRFYPDLSSRRVLTMEEVTGIKITDTTALAEAGVDKNQLTRNWAGSTLKQVFVDGFFHADPHPGNIFVQPGNRIAYLDFGMMGKLNRRLRSCLTDLLTNVVQRDARGIREAVLCLGRAPENLNLAELDADLEEFLDLYYNKSLAELNIGQMMLNLSALVRKNEIFLPPDLLLVFKVFITTEGISRRLEPGFTFVEQAKPFVTKLQWEDFNPDQLTREIVVFSKTLAGFIAKLPHDLVVIFNKIKKGHLKVEFEHKGLEQLTAEIDRSSNRIAFSLIVAALIIGSSIIVHFQGAQFLGFPLGILGFLAAGILGSWLVYVILRSKKL